MRRRSARLLLLDEPTSALDPAGRRDVRVLLGEPRSRGIAVLLNSHLLGGGVSSAPIIARHVLQESVRRRAFTVLFVALFAFATIEAFDRLHAVAPVDVVLVGGLAPVGFSRRDL